MSQLIYKYILKRSNLDHLIGASNSRNDIYFEEIPEAELGRWHKKGDKRRKKTSKHFPSKEYEILESVRKNSYRLDLQLSMCGFRFGWAGVVGLIPAFGDFLCLFLSLGVISKAEEIDGGLPPALKARMMANVIFDFMIGLIPILGDCINMFYKCNSRNYLLLEIYLLKKYPIPVEGNNTSPPHATHTGISDFFHHKEAIPVGSNTAAIESTNNQEKVEPLQHYPPPPHHVQSDIRKN